jgi:hypothetical protein
MRDLMHKWKDSTGHLHVHCDWRGTVQYAPYAQNTSRQLQEGNPKQADLMNGPAAHTGTPAEPKRKVCEGRIRSPGAAWKRIDQYLAMQQRRRSQSRRLLLRQRHDCRGGGEARAQMDCHRPWQVRHPHHAQAAHPGAARVEGLGKTLPRLRGAQPRALRAPGLSQCRRAPHRQEEGTGAGEEGAGVPRPDPEGLPCRAICRSRQGGRRLLPRQARRTPRRRRPDQPAGGRLFIEEVITECRKRGPRGWTCWPSSSRWACSPPCWRRPSSKGIDLAPKTIPPEVFDKRAVEKGQVRFHDVAYIEVTPRYDKRQAQAGRRNHRLLGLLQPGPGRVHRRRTQGGQERGRLRGGQALKLSKDKDGVVTRDVLTRSTGPTGSTTGPWISTTRAARKSSRSRCAWASKANCPAPSRPTASSSTSRSAGRGLHLRERVAELPHPPDRDLELKSAPTPTTSPAATPSPSRSSTSSATTP